MNIFQKFILVLFITATSVISAFITPEVGILKKLFFIGDSSLSYTMTSYLFGYLIGIICFGIFSKKCEGITTIRIGLIISLIGFFFQKHSIQSLNYNLFLIGRLVSAFGLSSSIIYGFSIIKDTLSIEEEKKFLSFLTVSFTGSIYLSVIISAYLLKIKNLYWIFEAEFFYSILLLFLTLFLPKSKALSVKKTTSSYKNFFSLKLISFSFALSITTIISYCYSFYAPLIMANKFSISPEKYSHYNLINLIGLTLGSITYYKLHKKTKEILTIKLCLLFCTVLCIFLNFLYIYEKFNLISFIIVFFLINILSGILYPSATYQAMSCCVCKKSSSATMNIIKIGMPSLALLLSSFLLPFPVFSLPITIVIFSTVSLFLLIFTQRKFSGGNLR